MMLIPQEPDRVAYGRIKLASVATVAAIGVAAGATLAIAGGVVERTAPAPEGAKTGRIDTALLPDPNSTRPATPKPPTQEYRWVDRERGLIRIPTDVAMDVYLQRQAKREAP